MTIGRGPGARRRWGCRSSGGRRRTSRGKKAGMQLVDAGPRVVSGGREWGSRRGCSTPRRRWRLGGKRSSSARWSLAVDGEVREWDPAIELAVKAARAEEDRVADLEGVGLERKNGRGGVGSGGDGEIMKLFLAVFF